MSNQGSEAAWEENEKKFQKTNLKSICFISEREFKIAVLKVLKMRENTDRQEILKSVIRPETKNTRSQHYK